MYISDEWLEHLISDDVPSIDLTTHVLGIGQKSGTIEYFTREEAVLCGTEEAARILSKLGCEMVSFEPSGARLAPGDVFLRAKGSAAALHMGWKCCQNIFEYYSALATKTRAMVDTVHAANPHCEVLTTRKLIPGTKMLDTKAIMVGGAFPHRLSLSETILVFSHHLAFCGGMDAFIRNLPQIKARICEKKLFVEAGAEDAVRLVEAGVDGIQVDKLPVDELKALVEYLRGLDSKVTIIAAGGVNLQNAHAYAATGVNGLATTCLHFAKPLDMSVHMASL